MIDCNQFRELVIRPTLPVPLYSPAAEELLISTIAVESSSGTYLKQIHGPALGVYEMEPPTYKDTWAYVKKSKYYDALMENCNFKEEPTMLDMITNLKFATWVARMKYFRDPHPLPLANDIEGLWVYYKRTWNSSLGATTRERFMKCYHDYVK